MTTAMTISPFGYFIVCTAPPNACIYRPGDDRRITLVQLNISFTDSRYAGFSMR